MQMFAVIDFFFNPDQTCAHCHGIYVQGQERMSVQSM